MIFKQGAEYVDSTHDTDSEAEEENQSPKKQIPKAFILPLFVGCALVLIACIVLLSKFSKQTPPVEPAPSASIVEGGAEYWEQFDAVFRYTDEERALLRSWGYTGSEIEAGELAETPAGELVAASKQAQEEARATLSNPESPEYQALLNDTWLGQQLINLPAYVEGETEGSIFYNTYTYNADYEKIPAHGNNLFLKVYMPDKSYAFMECPILRYMQLPESGNIVVQYQTATIDNQVIVYNMTEVAVQ